MPNPKKEITGGLATGIGMALFLSAFVPIGPYAVGYPSLLSAIMARPIELASSLLLIGFGAAATRNIRQSRRDDTVAETKLQSVLTPLRGLFRQTPLMIGGMTAGFALGALLTYLMAAFPPPTRSIWYMLAVLVAIAPIMLFYLKGETSLSRTRLRLSKKSLPAQETRSVDGQEDAGDEAESEVNQEDFPTEEQLGILIEKLNEEFTKEVRAAAQLSNLRTRADGTTDRISDEIDALARRGNLNLVIGILTTGAAVALLVYTVLAAELSEPTAGLVAAYYVPRVSLVAFIQIFAFFFLKLYRSSLSGIKYFQNELTNVELRFVAMEGALINRDMDTLKAVIDDLLKTERNFVLQKDETTVELQRSRIEKEGVREIFALVSDVLKAKSK